MEQLFLLFTVSCLASGFPIAQEENQGSISASNGGGLLLAIADDEQQSIIVLNSGDEKVTGLEVNAGENYGYHTRQFGKEEGYQFGYDWFNVNENEAQSFRHELKRPDGTLLGRYGYKDPNGDLQITNYISDKDGFQVLKPNDSVQLEPVVDNENVQGNEIKGRSNLLVDEPEADVPIVHGVVPPGAQDLSNGPNSHGWFLTDHQ